MISELRDKLDILLDDSVEFGEFGGFVASNVRGSTQNDTILSGDHLNY